MKPNTLLLGVDGGGTRCRARLSSLDGAELGEAVHGVGLAQSLNSVVQTVRLCLAQAGLASHDLPRITACLALAGASEPATLAAAQTRKFPFGQSTITTGARAACIGAHGSKPGGVIVAGTGAIGWAEPCGRRVGGWGLPVSDEGSGAWIGCEALRRVLWAQDGPILCTNLRNALNALGAIRPASFDSHRKRCHAISAPWRRSSSNTPTKMILLVSN